MLDVLIKSLECTRHENYRNSIQSSHPGGPVNVDGKNCVLLHRPSKIIRMEFKRGTPDGTFIT